MAVRQSNTENYFGKHWADERDVDNNFDVETLSPSEVAGQMDKELAASNNAAKVTEEQKPKVTKSRIRVLLSRPLTYAEKEDFETNWNDPHFRRISESGVDFSFRIADNMQHVWAEADFGSRIMFDIIATVCEQHFVNLYPKAVRTFREYNGN